MPLGWNEIRARALKFSKGWESASYEKGETQSFYNDFFDVFGVSRRQVGFYEQSIKKLNNKQGFIDLFWPATLLVEQKSAGRSLVDARSQAMDYLNTLSSAEFPRYILLSDFQNFELLDLETGNTVSFKLCELHKNVGHFAFIAGYTPKVYEDQDPVNIDASDLMSELHKQLEESGYIGHDLEMLLVRLMFCLFADDTGIFDKDHFTFYLENHTKPDGTDLGGQLLTLFDVLNTPEDKRQKTLDEDLARFPYVNGGLFEKPLRPVSFNSDMRKALMECCYFDWTSVSPALFGSLFQTVMLPIEQRKKGAHYTSEKNILKVIRPLFLDGLWEEFARIKTNRKKLEVFHTGLSKIRIFDPACGCGNFLILAYRALRELEIEILKAINPKDKHGLQTLVLDIKSLCKIDVDQFYGIEISEFPARIAETAMWLIDHQMNMKLSETFGQSFARLPLKKSAKIVQGNALTTDWKTVIEPSLCTYIVGNPPFIGKKEQGEEQKRDVKSVFKGIKGNGVMDYVACWYLKAADYIQNTNIKVAFVSTKSIVQGEQVGILWNEMYKRGSRIFFAHRTFKWTIDAQKAKGMKIAAVHVVIVGFSASNCSSKFLFEYETVTSDPHIVPANIINAYLVDGAEVTILSRRSPLCSAPEIRYGSIGIDDGHLVLTEEERNTLLSIEPEAASYIRPFIGADEYIKNTMRYCLWLKNISPEKLRNLKEVMIRVEKVKQFRLKSDRKETIELAKTPTLFGEIRQPNKEYLMIPKVSSENRHYIPIGYCPAEYIANGSSLIIPDADLYAFGVVTSEMHMSWMRYVGGRTKSDYQYSSSLIYNNFPWPECNAQQRVIISQKAQAVLEARAQFPNATLADLYDPNAMPPVLLKAHQELDRAVDSAYRKAPFKDERGRMEYLFELYQKISAPLDMQKIKKKKVVSKTVCV